VRYGIFSDIHSNLEAFEAVVEAYKRETVDKYFCVGDIVGYATNPKECIEKTKSFVEVSVAGNHDLASVDLFSVDYFNPDAAKAIYWTRRNLDGQAKDFLASLKLVYKNEDFTLAHGTLNDPDNFNYMTDGFLAEETFRMLETNLCFVGHTHVAGVFAKDKDGRVIYRADSTCQIDPESKYIINVGSVGQPRDGSPEAAYCIYDTEREEVQIKRVNYDIQTTRKKIIDAGLPRFLGERLFFGQ